MNVISLKSWCVSAALVVAASTTSAAFAASAKPVFSAPPRLATTAAELAKVQSSPEFAALRDAAVQAAQPLVANPIPLPEGHASWIFYYACPDDGRDLRMITLAEHECPACKKRYTDQRTVESYRCVMHYELEHAAVKLGWAYAYTGEEKYVQAVKRILLKLADDYDKYPARLDRWGNTGMFARLGGRRYVQSLDEAVGVIRLAKGYDLTRNSPVWTEKEKEHVERNFFRATADTLLVFNQDINNHQTWYNAGLMAIGSVLADAELIEKTLNMRGGYYDQLERSLGDDGLWYEGTMAYQNYALQAMIEIADAGRNLGLPLHERPRFKALLASPLAVAYPNGQFPVINDSDPSNVRMFNWTFEWAWKVYKDPAFAQAAAWGDPEKLRALLGPNAQPAWPLETKSINLADAGLAVLRVGEGADATCVFHDYGQHGGGHGHYDKLNITLFANGREWLLDTGRIGYTHKEYKTWVKHTVAHNTVVLGESDQTPTTGELLYLTTGDGYAACAGQSTGAYRGATLRRYLLLTSRMLVDVFDVEAARPTTLDWLAHAVTEPVAPVEAVGSPRPATLGSADGYEHLRNAQLWTTKGDTRWDFAAGKGKDALRLRVCLPGGEAEEIYTAVGIGMNVQQEAPTLIRRRKARQTRFVTVYDLSGQGEFVQKVEPVAGSSPRVKITAADGIWDVEFGADGVKLVRPGQR